MNNETQVANALKDTLFPMAPPRNLHEAMLAADEIVIMTNLEWANRFAHVSAVRESCANNVKIASVEGASYPAHCVLTSGPRLLRRRSPAAGATRPPS